MDKHCWEIKALIFPEPVFPKDLNCFLPQLFSKLKLLITLFNYLVIINFRVQNKSVVIWLKMCQLHLKSHWTSCEPSQTQYTEEKPNCTKLQIIQALLKIQSYKMVTPIGQGYKTFFSVDDEEEKYDKGVCP
jgi:hypothetical protein